MKVFLPYMGVTDILVMRRRSSRQLLFPYPMEASYEIWLQSTRAVVFEETMFEKLETDE